MSSTDAQSVETSPAGHQQSPDTDKPSVDRVQRMVTEAVGSKNVEKLRSLLAQYPDVPLSDATLQLASYKGTIPIFATLVERHPSIVYSEFQTRGTPLGFALQSGATPSFISYLLSLGAGPNQLTDGDYWLPLTCAAFAGDECIESIALLLGKGARLDYSDALHMAAIQGHVETTRFLLDHGATPMKDPQDAYLRPPDAARMSLALWSAIEQNHPVIVRLLLDHGRGPGEWEDGGETALELAEKNGNEEILNLLRAYGAHT